MERKKYEINGPIFSWEDLEKQGTQGMSGEKEDGDIQEGGAGEDGQDLVGAEPGVLDDKKNVSEQDRSSAELKVENGINDFGNNTGERVKKLEGEMEELLKKMQLLRADNEELRKKLEQKSIFKKLIKWGVLASAFLTTGYSYGLNSGWDKGHIDSKIDGGYSRMFSADGKESPATKQQGVIQEQDGEKSAQNVLNPDNQGSERREYSKSPLEVSGATQPQENGSQAVQDQDENANLPDYRKYSSKDFAEIKPEVKYDSFKHVVETNDNLSKILKGLYKGKGWTENQLETKIENVLKQNGIGAEFMMHEGDIVEVSPGGEITFTKKEVKNDFAKPVELEVKETNNNYQPFGGKYNNPWQKPAGEFFGYNGISQQPSSEINPIITKATHEVFGDLIKIEIAEINDGDNFVDVVGGYLVRNQKILNKILNNNKFFGYKTLKNIKNQTNRIANLLARKLEKEGKLPSDLRKGDKIYFNSDTFEIEIEKIERPVVKKAQVETKTPAKKKVEVSQQRGAENPEQQKIPEFEMRPGMKVEVSPKRTQKVEAQDNSSAQHFGDKVKNVFNEKGDRMVSYEIESKRGENSFVVKFPKGADKFSSLVDLYRDFSKESKLKKSEMQLNREIIKALDDFFSARNTPKKTRDTILSISSKIILNQSSNGFKIENLVM